MHESEKNRLVNEIRRYRLAQADMRQVLAAVKSLTKEHHNGYLCRALETAIVVCYARAFAAGNEIGTLGDEWTPDDPGMDGLELAGSRRGVASSSRAFGRVVRFSLADKRRRRVRAV